MIKKKLNKTARETRKKTREALLKLFETKKIDGITVMDIHQKTGYSRQTFYRHYKSVDEVFEDIVSEMFDAFESDFLTGKEINLNEFLCLFFHWAKDEMKEINLFLKAGCVNLLIQLYFTLTMDVLDKAMPTKFSRDETASKEKLILLGTIMSMAYHWIMTGFSDSPEQLADYIESKLNL
jgi:AcrR family transcriptional regulator